jgi:transcriptional regulator with XRE-family HTH domain
MPWKDFPFVDIAFDLTVEACVECDEVLLSSHEIEELDLCLEKSIRAQTANFLKIIKHESKLNQKTIASKIGLSEAYISDLISKKKTSSYQIFNLIKILANHPSDLDDLKCFVGNCEERSTHLETFVLRKKFAYSSDLDFEQLSSGSNFVNMMNEEQEHLH